MKEQLISYETAKLAKLKGFNWETWNTYLGNKDTLGSESMPYNHNQLNNRNSAPTQSLLQKWLREEKNIHINTEIIRYSVSNKKILIWQVEIYNFDIRMLVQDQNYEKVLEKGLQKALELI